MTWIAVLRLVRVSLFASAIGDPLLGYVLGGGGSWVSALGLALSSLCIYHGGMALNDWADREVDQRSGRTRPLTSGALKADEALRIAIALLAAGLLIPLVFGLPMLALGCIAIAALSAVLYDLRGRGPVRGPALLATARGANLAFGAAAAGGLGGPTLFAAGVYALLVFWISRLGRFEDGEAELATAPTAPTQLLQRIAGLLVLGPFLVAVVWYASADGRSAPPLTWLAMALAWLLVVRHGGLLRRLAKRDRWTPAEVERVMGPCLGSLGLFTLTGLLAVATTPLAGALALALFSAQRTGRHLMRRFPPS